VENAGISISWKPVLLAHRRTLATMVPMSRGLRKVEFVIVSICT